MTHSLIFSLYFVFIGEVYGRGSIITYYISNYSALLEKNENFKKDSDGYAFLSENQQEFRTMKLNNGKHTLSTAYREKECEKAANLGSI